MKAGDVTKPLRTPSGFHIVKLNEMQAAASRSSSTRCTRGTS